MKRSIRTCIACRASAPKEELIRIAVVLGDVVIDREQKCLGRGAYLHHSKSCFSRKIDIKRWKHALKTATLRSESIERVIGELANGKD